MSCINFQISCEKCGQTFLATIYDNHGKDMCPFCYTEYELVLTIKKTDETNTEVSEENCR